ncbi:MAG TPA: DUF4020 domain-containing protein [Terriglobales bacterium]
MRIRQIDLPAAVLDAQRSGRLVIFAGAGVSMDSPSNYPDFNDLAAQVGGELHPRQMDEAIDRYLGRLAGIGVTVHEQVAKILSSPDSKPNPNHKAIIEIFKDSERVRIVTTNFDRHFTTAAETRYATTVPEVFYAPALPIGNDFTGIVYLHGSVEKHPRQLVLTDSDFGRAYITEGWATRFLERLFSHFVVLFVGYSHEDMLLSYLARGLAGGSVGPGRYTLIPPGDDVRWTNLGITPIHYPLSEPPTPQRQELPIALAAWAEQSQAGALAVEERIRRIVTGSLPLTPEDDDFLKEAVSELSTLRFFTRHTRGAQWLHWVEAHSSFQRLFTLRSDYSETDWELAGWFATQFAVQHSEEALDVIRRKGGLVSPLISRQVISHLFRQPVHGQVLSKWLAVILASVTPAYRDDELKYVLKNCSFPEDEQSILMLFEHLTRPVVRLKEAFKWRAEEESSTTVDAEVECGGEEYWLEHGWNQLFVPNIGALARRLAVIVTSHLSTARQLLVGFGKANSDWDPVSFSRGMIESREQDHLRNGLSVLIDAGAAVITWACEQDTSWADALINNWFGLDSPLLRRLAIYGMAISGHINADEKLKWIASNELVFKLGYKHEVFVLMLNAYPRSSVDARKKFVEKIQSRKKKVDADPETATYELFNVVSWLAKSDPKCGITAELRASLKEANPNFGEREHPDMDSWIGSAVYGGMDSPVSSTDLLSYDLDKLLAALSATPDTSYPEATSKQGLLYKIGQTAQESHEWGVKIAQQARERSNWSKELWDQIIGAWAATDLSEAEWTAVLDFLHGSPSLYETLWQSITSLLERGVQSTKAPIPSSLLSRAKDIADGVWVYCAKVEAEELGEQADWFSRAINHPAGHLFEFYVHSLARLQRDKLLLQDRFDEYKHSLAAALEGVSIAAQLARVVLASRLHFLFQIGEEWTTGNVFPLLDATRDEFRARQCWHGYLYSRWTDAMIPGLLPLYEGMFPLIDNEKDKMRRGFCGHLAGIAVYASIHPLETGWLSRFVAAVKSETRALWADQLHFVIKNLDGPAKLHLWQRWLQTYWEERLQGRPLPLTPNETGEMVDWVLDLGPVIPEVVDLVCESPYPDLGHSMVYYSISESVLLKQYPDAFTKLLLFLTTGERARPIYDLDRLQVAVEQLVELNPRNPQLWQLCDELARLGISGVAILAARLELPNDPPPKIT